MLSDTELKELNRQTEAFEKMISPTAKMKVLATESLAKVLRKKYKKTLSRLVESVLVSYMMIGKPAEPKEVMAILAANVEFGFVIGYMTRKEEEDGTKDSTRPSKGAAKKSGTRSN